MWKWFERFWTRAPIPNITGMGLTPFLIAAGVGTGGRGTGLASSTSAGGPVNTAIMDLLLEHGADVNAQVTGTKTYSLRISRAPSSTEGMTALHVAAQKGRADEVRYLLAKGAKTDLLDSKGRKPIDLAGTGATQPGAAAPAPPAGAAGNRWHQVQLPELKAARPALLEPERPVGNAATQRARPKFAPFCRTRAHDGKAS